MKMLLHYDVTSTRDTGVTSCFSMFFWMAAAESSSNRATSIDALNEMKRVGAILLKGAEL